MTESAAQFPISPKNILENLKSSELKSIKPKIVDFSWLAEATPINDEALVAEVFANNKSWAESFFKRRDELGIQVFADPLSPTNVYIATSRENAVVTILKSRKRDLRGQVEIRADNLYISDPSLKQAIDTVSLLPSSNKSVLFSMTAFKASDAKENERTSYFGFHRETNTFLFDPIIDIDGLTSSCHEIGHIWANALKIDVETNDQHRARRSDYQVEKDVEKRGWEEASKGISEVLFSERSANLIGKIIARKIEDMNIFPRGVLSRAWRDTQEARYDEHYLVPLIKKFPEFSDKIKVYFASRLNRVKMES